MPIIGWIIFAIISFCICFIATIPVVESEGKTRIIILIAIFAVLIGLATCMCWYYQNTESGRRAFKDQESNFSGGITRRVNVYDMEGDLLTSYEGTFDIEMNDTRILFDDEKGDRHIIYFTTGTVTIDEISGNS